MAMTTQGSTQVPPVPVAKQPAVTSANLPKPPVQPTEPLSEFDDSIEARPLVAPHFFDVKVKNQENILAWVNFKVGREESSLRYQEAKAKGYRNALKEDVLDGPWMGYWREDLKSFINGDLILMLHSRRAVLGDRKYRREMAQRLVSRAERVSVANSKIREGIGEDGLRVPAKHRQSIQAFIPSEKDLKELGGEEVDGT